MTEAGEDGPGGNEGELETARAAVMPQAFVVIPALTESRMKTTEPCYS
ncbi:hypothetical protein [Paenibacillus sp. RC67]|nr:hypothetical protein [Paenibacillus sp. RC67]